LLSALANSTATVIGILNLQGHNTAVNSDRAEARRVTYALCTKSIPRHSPVCFRIIRQVYAHGATQSAASLQFAVPLCKRVCNIMQRLAQALYFFCGFHNTSGVMPHRWHFKQSFGNVHWL
jgi:hypothetical protein